MTCSGGSVAGGRLMLRLLLLLPVLYALPLPTCALDLHQTAERGHEVHSGRILVSHLHQDDGDSLRLGLVADWRDGFRDYNRQDRRISQQLDMLLYHDLGPSLQLLGRIEEELYNEKRFQRESFDLAAESGIGWQGPLRVELLGGWTRYRRAERLEDGPRLRGGLGLQRSGPGWTLGTNADMLWEEPGSRRNREAQAGLEFTWRGDEETLDLLRLSYDLQQEDVVQDSRLATLERRRRQNVRVFNRFETPVPGLGRGVVEVDAWSRRQRRDPRSADSLSTTSSGDSRDLGIRLDASHRMDHGPLYHEVVFVLLRQNQQDAYGPHGRPSETNSQVLLNRLDLELGWNTGVFPTDTLRLRAKAELRGRDTEFEGAVARTDDFTDHALRDIEWSWTLPLRPGARLRAELGLLHQVERHLQAEYSRNNHLRRSWRAGFEHRLRLGRLLLTGESFLLADYRLYDYDSATQPRSWLQRRLRMREQPEWLLDMPGPGRWTVKLPLAWVEEDGGSYLRDEGLERISNSARELRADPLLVWIHRGLSIQPGFSWYMRRDYTWSAGSEGRIRTQSRALYRRGPRLVLHASRGGHRFSLDLLLAKVRDGDANGLLHDRSDLSGKIEWGWQLR